MTPWTAPASGRVLVGDRLPEPGDGGAEPGLVLVVRAACLDPLVELVFQVGVPLGERVAGDAGLDGERDDGQRAVGPPGGAFQDARVSQIESGDVSTQDLLSRFVAALGGTLKLIADFGDEQLKLA
jgi:hypothetical protein